MEKKMESDPDSTFRWDTIFDAIEDCVFLMDADFKIIKTNRALRDFLKRTDDEIIGKHCWELIHGTVEPPDFCPMSKMMKNNKRESADVQINGIYVRITLDPILDKDGSIKGAVHIIRDIDETERKNVVIRESEKKYHELVDTMSDVIFTLDFDGNVIDTSQSMKKIIGLSPEESIGKHFSDFVHPDDLLKAEEEFLRAIQGKGHPIEIRIIPADGVPRWVRINALLIMRDGEPDNLLCVLSDIHEKKIAEEKLRKSEEELIRSNEILKKERDKAQHYLNAARAIILIMDRNGNVKQINKRGCEILGRNENEILGRNWFDNFLPENARAEVKRVFDEIMAGNIAMVEHYENPILASDGKIRMISWHNAIIRDESGGVDSALSAGEDITERLQMEMELKIASENLTRINTSLIDAKLRSQTYFDFLAHDIANIMSPIMAYAELMSKEGGYPPEVLSFTEKIVDQAQKATSLIHNLRKLEMLEERNLPDMNIIDIRRIFTFVENSIRHKYPDKKPTFVYHLPEDIPIKSRGGEYIDFVIRHVFDNAVRHARKESVNIDVRIEKAGKNEGNEFWQIVIDDDGPGISDRMKKEITTPLDPAKRYSRGVASSLAFCAAALIGIGGELQIEDRVPNDKSRGTRVIVWIPVYD